MRLGPRCLLLALPVFLAARQAAAQTPTDEPRLADLASRFQTDALRVGMLIQVHADYQPERSEPGTNGFSINNLRLSISGALDGGFSYALQANFVTSPALVDARIGYEASPLFHVDAGRFKAAFSREALTSARSLDFVQRSRGVRALAPGRQIGVQVSGGGASGVRYAVGIFSGPRSDNASGLVLGVARLTLHAAGADAADAVDAGVSIGAGRDGVIDGRDDVVIPTDDRVIAGVHARYTHGPFLVSAELVAARLGFEDSPTTEPWGYHATAGYRPSRRTQLLARWDRYADAPAAATDRILVGFNARPTTPTELQVNWVIPVEGSLDTNRLVVNFQIGF